MKYTHSQKYLDAHCKHCGGLIKIANPKGYCSHIHYPENCDVCSKSQKYLEKKEHAYVSEVFSSGCTKIYSKPEKESKYKLVYIEWMDAVVSTNRWTWDDEIDFDEEEKAMLHASTGWLIKENKNMICLSQSVKLNPHDTGAISVSLPITIPLSAIRKRKVLKV